MAAMSVADYVADATKASQNVKTALVQAKAACIKDSSRGEGARLNAGHGARHS